MLTTDHFNRLGAGRLPGHLGIVVTKVGESELRSELAIGPVLMAANGFLHAGTVVTLADTSAGYGCVSHLLAADASPQVLEGERSCDKLVLMSFPDEQACREWSDSAAYRRIAEDRRAGADAVVMRVTGLGR